MKAAAEVSGADVTGAELGSRELTFIPGPVRAGTYTYSYLARATTPGQFVVPPPRAEEMYSPETFGRGRTERVVVEPEDEK